ncbi:MAG: thermonuclease family protein [Pseudomonadota bacterium]
MSDSDTPEGQDAIHDERPRHLSPLSIQAAALLRSIDGLTTIFWITIGGTILSVLFAGLMQLEVNLANDYIYVGEYQVPKSILPLSGAGFALFLFWLTGNRLRMLQYVLSRSEFPVRAVRDLFRLNPPLLSVFSSDNQRRWSLGNGVAVLLLLWGIYFGNSVAIVLRASVEAGALSSQFEPLALASYAAVLLATGAYGVFAITRPLRRIFSELHGEELVIGWPRYLFALFISIVVIGANNASQISTAEQDNDLLGPAMATAIDGGTIYLNGIEVVLIGLRALGVDQVCQDAKGADYACGRAARQHLQELVQSRRVICAPLLNAGRGRVVATCRELNATEAPPDSYVDYFEGEDRESLSDMMVSEGLALASGLATQALRDKQNAAQATRRGIWQGSFDPSTNPQ